MATGKSGKQQDFMNMAEERYKELKAALEAKQAEVDEIKVELGPIEAMLKAAGKIVGKKRGPRKKKEEAPAE